MPHGAPLCNRIAAENTEGSGDSVLRIVTVSRHCAVHIGGFANVYTDAGAAV